MSRSKGYNPRLNNNSTKKQVVSDVKTNEQEVKQSMAEEIQPEVVSDGEQPDNHVQDDDASLPSIIDIEEDSGKLFEEIEQDEESGLQNPDVINDNPEEVVEETNVETTLIPKQEVLDEWLKKVIDEEKLFPTRVELEKVEVTRREVEKTTFNMDALQKYDEIKSNDEKKPPHYTFKRNDAGKIERIVNIPNEEKVNNMDDNKKAILTSFLDEINKLIPKLELEVEIQEIIVSLEIEPNKLTLAQKKLENVRENLNTNLLRKKAIEQLVNKY